MRRRGVLPDGPEPWETIPGQLPIGAATQLNDFAGRKKKHPIGFHTPKPKPKKR
jgi:hypothetical protein